MTESLHLTVIGTGVALLAVLVPLVLALHARQAQGLAEFRREVREDLALLRKDVADLNQRLAHVEGAVLGPWRPTEPAPPAGPLPDEGGKDTGSAWGGPDA